MRIAPDASHEQLEVQATGLDVDEDGYSDILDMGDQTTNNDRGVLLMKFCL